MNKKRLSVVMAGAMLASSVAPVLAATETEVDTSRLGALVEKVHEKLISKRFTTDASKLADKTLAGQSVYYVKVNGKLVDGIATLTVKGSEETLRTTLQEKFKDLTAEDKVEIYTYGSAEDKDKNIVDCTVTEEPKYVAADFAKEEVVAGGHANATTKAIHKTLYAAKGADAIKSSNHVRVVTEGNEDVIKIYLNGASDAFKNLEGATSSSTYKVLTLKKGDRTLDFSKVIESGKEKNLSEADLTKVTAFVANKVSYGPITDTLEETIKITGVTHNYKTEDLYDGLMLTTEGHDLLSIIKENDDNVVMEQLDGSKINKGTSNVVLTAYNSEYGFKVTVKDKFNKTTVYTIKGAKEQTQVLATWYAQRLAKVDILAGANRYETAVSIAKEQLGLNAKSLELDSSKKVKNIVLVNGNSLVDGLSAAPLAAVLGAGLGDDKAAPVLLTEADELPKATKAYLLELMKGQTIGADKAVTVHLVGGTAVLNRSLEKELKAMGFGVERYNGDNREETSLEVAKAILDKRTGVESGLEDARFVVGAEGEADAMSISGYASMKKIPVIVSKKGGLTYEGLNALEDKKVTVIGGEAAVSAADYEEIKEEADAVRRIAGANRQATNAAIIKEFYHEGTNTTGINALESVIVAKDGRGNKTELVDALTAANLAAQTNAPVVLAKSSLTEDQIDAIRLRAKKADSLYQVGHGVERSVMETVASKLGLLHK